MTVPPPHDLTGIRILVVEDTLLIADLIVEQLEEVGCDVIGPASHVERALALVEAERLDGALLDINLRGELCFPIADALAERGVPLAFLTGYGESVVPPAYRARPRLSKPFLLSDLIDLVECYFAKGAAE
jgi:CheY-like chemotaxis protein